MATALVAGMVLPTLLIGAARGAAATATATAPADSVGALAAATADYTQIGEWPVPGEPFSLSVTSAGVMVALVPDVPDPEFRSVRLYTPDGNELWAASVRDMSGRSIRPVAAAAAPGGGAYVSGQDALVRLGRDGSVMWSGPAGDAGPEFGAAARALESAEGLLWQTDLVRARIVAYDPLDGTLRKRIGTLGTALGSYLSPRDLVVTSAGELAVADWGLRRVTIVDTIGEVQGSFALTERPRSIAALAGGELLILLDDETVVHASQGGVIAFAFGGRGRGSNELLLASDLAVDRDGRVFVADRGNRRVTVYQAVMATPGTQTAKPGTQTATSGTPTATSATPTAFTSSTSTPVPGQPTATTTTLSTPTAPGQPTGAGSAQPTPAGSAQPTMTVPAQPTPAETNVTRVFACPGRPAEVTLQVPLPAVPARADVLLIVDTTGSMESVVSTLDERSEEVWSTVKAMASDAAMGVMEVRDYPYGRAGLPTDWPYALRHPMTEDPGPFYAAVGELAAGGGGDAPEAYAGAITHGVTSDQVGWRGGARRVVVLIGDSVPRDDNLNEAVVAPPVGGIWAPGEPRHWLDSGSDWAPMSADDLDWQPSLDALRASDVYLAMLVTGSAPAELAGRPDLLLHYWRAWAERAGGHASQLGSLASLPGAIAGLLPADGIIRRLDPGALPVERAGWVTFDPSHYTDIDLSAPGTSRSFTALVAPSNDTVNGVYPMALVAEADGVLRASLSIEVEWRTECEPGQSTPSATSAVEGTATQNPTPTTTASETSAPSATLTPPIATTSAPPTSALPSSPTPSPRSPSTPFPDLYLPVALQHYCHRRVPAVEAVLVIDTSSSMSGEKLEAARAAALEFVRALKMPSDRAAVVAFNAAVRSHTPLHSSVAPLEAAIGALDVAEGTRIDLGLRAATSTLVGQGRSDSRHVIVLLTDGRPEPGTEAAALAEANSARAAGVRLVVVGLGTDVDSRTLHELAGDSRNVFVAPRAGDLASVYRDLAAAIPCD